MFVMFELLGSYRLLANNLAPNAYIVLSGSTLTGKTALFSGLYSSDPDGGSIAAYEWAVDGIIQPGSTEVLGVFKYVCTLAEGQTSRTATIRLRVKDDDNGGTWSSYVYKTITISAVNRTEYYLTDHLGSIRTTIDQTGTVIGYDDYDPFGNVLPGRSYNAGTPNDLNKFTGVERDTEGNINLDAFGRRLYDPEIGRFYGVDRFHFKYPSINPFQYAANNPIFFIDVNGDIINVKTLQNVDAAKSTNTTGQIVNDLQSITGLTLSISKNGMLTYAKDSNGKAIIAKDADGNAIGSSIARNDLANALDQLTIVDVGVSNKGSKAGGNTILIDAGQINNFINGTTFDLDDRTLGFGMTFLHEINHTNIGGGLKDDRSSFGMTGPVVDRMNSIRNELGSSFGQRTSYMGVTFSPTEKPSYIPFSEASKKMLNHDIIPFNSFVKSN